MFNHILYLFWNVVCSLVKTFCMKYCLDIFFNYNNSASGQLPPSRTITSWMVVPGQLSPKESCPPDNCPKENCPLDNCPMDDCPVFLLPNSCLKDNAHEIYPGNCPRGKLPFGLFVTYIIAPLTNCPEENCPQGK